MSHAWLLSSASRTHWILGGCLLVVSFIGCRGSVEDPATAALRDKFLVPKIDGAVPLTLTDAAELLASEPKSDEPPSLTVVGRIYAGDLEPWDPGRASFVLSELPAEGHGEGHDADNCPFCKRRAANAPTGIIKFVDAEQQTLPVDARQLFGLESKQQVIVRGQASAGEFNSIVIVADQMQLLQR